jgi:hypothetical protein
MSRDDIEGGAGPDTSAGNYPGGNAPWNSGPDAPINYSPPLGQGGGTPPNTNPYTGAPSAGFAAPSTPATSAPGGAVGGSSAPGLGPISSPVQTTPYNPGSVQYAQGHLYVYTTHYDSATNQSTYGWLDLGLPATPGFDWAAASTASGTPMWVLQQQYQQGLKQSNQQGNAVLRNKNPDGTYSVTMPDGTIQNQTLQQLAGLSSISAGDIAQADRDFAYSSMRAKEANWVAGGVQLYNGGAGPGATAPTMQPAPPQTPPGPAPMPQPNPYTPPPQPGATPSPNPMWGAATTQGAATTLGTTAPQSVAQTQGAPMATSMLPMQRATGASDPAATAAPVGNYGNSNGSWQDYELGTRGLQNQYERGNYTFQMGTPTYGQGGETRQQFTQRVNDLQNQYNMSKATFDLSHQGQQQANEGQQLAVQANKNQQMGQGRTIYGGGLGSLNPMRVTGLS